MLILPIFLFGVPNSSELIVTLLIVAVLFGGKKIPELAKGLGQGIREFNDAKNGVNGGVNAARDVQVPTSAQNNDNSK
jgi:sec-independent protein translocase protein TatA